MIQNFIGSGGGESFDATVTPGSDTTRITFSNIPAEPVTWAVLLFASNGVGTGALSSQKYIIGYLHGGEYDYGEAINSSGISSAGMITPTYNAGSATLELETSGGDKWIHGSGMSYRLIYTI